MACHLTGPFRIVRAATKYFRDAAKKEMESGELKEPRCVVNVSSTSGLHGNVGQANYSTAKAGINGFTKMLAKEWGPFGIRCNSIAFGFIETRLTNSKEEGASMKVGDKEVALGIPQGMRDMAPQFIPMRRTGDPDEGAAGIFFLASPFASYVSGHVLEVTGGSGI